MHKITTMIDLDYLHFLENILTENRKERFLEVLKPLKNLQKLQIIDLLSIRRFLYKFKSLANYFSEAFFICNNDCLQFPFGHFLEPNSESFFGL